MVFFVLGFLGILVGIVVFNVCGVWVRFGVCRVFFLMEGWGRYGDGMGEGVYILEFML